MEWKNISSSSSYLLSFSSSSLRVLHYVLPPFQHIHLYHLHFLLYNVISILMFDNIYFYLNILFLFSFYIMFTSNSAALSPLGYQCYFVFTSSTTTNIFWVSPHLIHFKLLTISLYLFAVAVIALRSLSTPSIPQTTQSWSHQLCLRWQMVVRAKKY